MANIINGKEQAKYIIEKIKSHTEKYLENNKNAPNLSVILVGDNKASQTYVKSKMVKAKECGFEITLHKYEDTISESELLALIHKLNEDDAVNGILVQLPLPGHINSNYICQSVSPSKDVDGFTQKNIGALWSNYNSNYTSSNYLFPCTPLGIINLIEKVHGTSLSYLGAVVIGRSNIVGKPIASMLLQHDATVTIVHSHTRDLHEVTKSADILVSAVGSAKMIKKNFIKPGATVIDVGINYYTNDDNKECICGDVDFEDCKEIAGHITPVPGGVGPMTIAMLMYNVLKSACIKDNFEILQL